MGYSEKCPGYRSYMECRFKEKRGADPHITDDEYKHNCVYDYVLYVLEYHKNTFLDKLLLSSGDRSPVNSNM